LSTSADVIDRIVEGVRVITPPVYPAAVSLALASMIDGPPGMATVLGSAEPAVWIGRADGVLVLSTTDAVRLPNGVVVASSTSERPFEGVTAGDEVLVGDGLVTTGTLRIRAARWFDPLPALPTVEPALVADSVVSLDEVVVSLPDHGLMQALIDNDDRAAHEAALHMIGRGDGLTPMGDDLVAGTAAGALLIGGAIGAVGVIDAVARLRRPLLEHAAGATTSFSASLLAHAFRGEVAEPAGRLLAALTGRGDAREAAEGLNRVGHSSGPALAAGVLSGARAAIERSR
jgi:hypothetical protein